MSDVARPAGRAMGALVGVALGAIALALVFVRGGAPSASSAVVAPTAPPPPTADDDVDRLYDEILTAGQNQATGGDLTGALDTLGTALLVRPLRCEAHQRRAQILLRMDRAEHARHELLDATRLEPGRATLWADLATVHERLGSPREATLMLRRAQAVASSDDERATYGERIAKLDLLHGYPPDPRPGIEREIDAGALDAASELLDRYTRKRP